ncbi:MAG: PepSY domain-containing protein [Sphingomonadaceae bacterium]|nr:PepSY domain-containing protein [Sphingomonadaceae bacterium]
MTVGLRKVVFQIHLWLGLTIGLLWAMQGLTGATLVFWREIDRLSMSVVTHGPPAPLDSVVASARAQIGAAPIDRVAYKDQTRDLFDVYYRDPSGHLRALQIDASSARVAGGYDLEPSSPFTGAATRWIYKMHMALTLGDAGETLIGISGLFLLSALGFGLWMGWPRRHGWSAAFAVQRWKKREHRLFGWHRMIGLVAGFALCLNALTGAGMVFEDTLRQGIAMVMPYQAFNNPMGHHAPPGPSLRNAGVSAGQALAIARARFPKAPWTRIFMPTAAKPYYSVRLRRKGDSRAWLGATTVSVDARTGAIIDVYDAVDAPFSNRLLDALYPIHIGEFGGLIGRLLVLCAGLSLPFFYVTGMWAWLSKRRQKAQRAADRSSRFRDGV